MTSSVKRGGLLSETAALLAALLVAGSTPVWAGWSPQSSGTTSDLKGVHFPLDTTTGYAVGNGGAILKTNDGGLTWTAQTSGTANSLRGVRFPVDATVGYAVGASGTILKTVDGGATWSPQVSGTTNTLNTIHFPVDATTGYVVGASGTILKTTGGGATWTAQSSGTTNNLISVHFPVDALTGYAVGGAGTILKTIDGGTTWVPQTSGTTNRLRSVFFPADATTGYAVGDAGTILKTTDGGTTWSPQTSGTLNDLRAVHFPKDAITGYVVGFAGTILKTSDGGANWTLQSSGTSNNLFGVHFPVDSSEGYAVGSLGTILSALDCTPLTTTEGAGTITVTAPESFELVFDDANASGSIKQFYDLASDPGRTLDLAGGSRTLYYDALRVGGTWYDTRRGGGGTATLLESTPTRVRVRQDTLYLDSSLNPLAGVRAIADHSIYPSGRLALAWNRITPSSIAYVEADVDIVVRFEGSGALNTWSLSSETDNTQPNPGTDAFVLAQIDQPASQVVTDFLHIIYQTYAAATAIQWGTSTSFSRAILQWWDGDGGSTVAGVETFNFLTYFKPTNLGSTPNPWQDPEVTGRRDGYRASTACPTCGPDSLSISAGSGWNENTSDADFFNESEAAYTLDFDMGSGLTFDMDGSITTRHSPFFKIRQWRSFQDPSAVTLEGAALTNDTDFRADVKPLARAHWGACGLGCFTDIAHGGLVGHASEYLADGSAGKNFTLSFASVNTEHLYLGADSKFRGLNISLSQNGVGSADLQWEYWNGTGWADLEAVTGFTDGTSSLTKGGSVYWTSDPTNWAVTIVNGGPELYYVRAYLASGSYSTAPVEGLIKTDILLFQYCRDIEAAAQTFDFGVPIPTAVELSSFEATGADGEVELSWETASELNNLGFHLYRSSSETERYERITTVPIPGLGSSPVGAKYTYRDRGLENGVTYYYKLEDIETTGRTELHGPVSAAPSSDGLLVSDERASADEPDEPSTRITYGEPSANALRVLRRSRSELVLELSTAGFYAEPQEDGSVRLEVPGFESGSSGPGVPVKRAWVDAVAGRKVKLVSIRARGVEAFTSLRPATADAPDVAASPDGTVRARRRRARKAFRGAGLSPPSAARIVSTGFQDEKKKVLLELTPLRWDASRGQLLLARRLVVRLSFKEREPQESTLADGVRGRRYAKKRRHDRRHVVARFGTTEPGLYAVRYEDVMRGRRGLGIGRLRLSRQGETVAFHVEPASAKASGSRSRILGPGSTLYFVSEGASANPYGTEAVYELEAGRRGKTMPVLSASPSGRPIRTQWHREEWQEDRYYQAALVEAPDRWLWDVLFAPVVKSYPFEVRDLAPSAEPSRFGVWLQGVSDFRADPDHHVRVSVNGSVVAELSWDGKRAEHVEVELAPGLLREGDNVLELENVGDTGASYSMVMLDRYAVEYPRLARASGGRLRGRWHESGTAELSGLLPGTRVLETGGSQPSWLVDTTMGADGVLRFRAESGRRYLAVSPEAVLHPVVTKPTASRLKWRRNRADYLVIGPAELLQAARPLLELRQKEGLKVRAVPVEQLYSEFGFGEPTPEAIREFLSYAYHEWRRPSPRYVLLLGDATFDFKDRLQTGVTNQVPPRIVKTTYLWTASDPSYAAVNGEDLLPDMAIGRLPAASADEVRAIVEKIVAYETGGAGLSRSAVVLVADNPDDAGDFERDADALAASVLAGRNLHRIFLRELGTSATRNAILQSFDDGASLLSYLGHGGIHLWANENFFNTSDVASLAPQFQQPVLLTMNCLNGYFHFPYFDSLAEALVLAPDKGAIAAFSPSGLSLNGPAQVYHRALLEELFRGNHARLGDAILAAQQAYADTGAFPELLTIYHLLGDPALTLE